jgi:hypothetical protein
MLGGPGGCLDWFRKLLPTPGFYFQTGQIIVSRYTHIMKLGGNQSTPTYYPQH